MTDRIIRTARLGRMLRNVADAVRSVVAPAALVRATTDPAVPDPADVFTNEEMPTPEEIEEAAAEYAAAADQARAADRAKRKSKKVLGRLPAGLYGRWEVERVQSSRVIADLDLIRATYDRLGLGPVPMRPVAPSLRVTELAAVEQLPTPAAADLPRPIAA
ncbi:hypothetical protein [Streptomyces sp. NPDC057496]|uniref:hypothetical protein n=1 Tax=Streptomyces sp. NPDC057496 TaxID=3346149 RepID=UPI0036B13B6C